MLDVRIRHWPLPETSDFPVAYRAGRAIARAEFERDFSCARAALVRLAASEIVLFEADAYDFSVWLLAAWSLGIMVVLPGDDLSATRALLECPWVGAGEKNVLRDWSGISPDDECGRDDFGVPGLTLFTSGSNGQPCSIVKTVAQLRHEVVALERCFGAALRLQSVRPPEERGEVCREVRCEVRFISSVPHQHMFGLPFAILWPLACGYPIVAERLSYPENLWRLPAAAYVLVSAPTLLKRLPQFAASATSAASADSADSGERGIRWLLAFSAGSPLPADTETQCRNLLQAPLIEIYGSTETGAVAYRRQNDTPWQTVPGVRLSVDADSSRLRVHSPFLPSGLQEAGFLSGDLADIGEDGLRLTGRADRIVKIEGKRVALDRVEEALTALAEIARAEVLPLYGEREALGAVVVLSPEGQEKLGVLGKARFDRFLRGSLRGQLEAVALPRRWHYVGALPVNGMGKTTRNDLQRLFAPTLPQAQLLGGTENGGEERGTEKAEPRAEPRAELRVELRLTLDPALVWFEGHFPELPVLPGIVQIDWAVHFGRRYFALAAPVGAIHGLKFQRLIRPGDTLWLDLSWRRDKRQLEFSYRSEQGPCSRGTLALMEAPVEALQELSQKFPAAP